MNYSMQKENEKKYQDDKYKKSLVETQSAVSPEEFERQYLSPYENGGLVRGLLFKSAIDQIPIEALSGKKVLDYCCGRGQLAVYLAQKGAVVCGIDIAPSAIEVGKRKAEANHVTCDLRTMDAEDLDYPDESFDYIIGFEALHHVIILPNAVKEISRVLKADGTAIFAENWGSGNWLMQMYRKMTSIKDLDFESRGEVILGKRLISKYVDQHFSVVEVYPVSCLYMMKKKTSNKLIISLFRKIDSLFKPVRFFHRFFGEAVVVLRRPVK